MSVAQGQPAGIMNDNLFAKVAQQIIPGGRLLRCWPLEGGVSATTHALELCMPEGDIRRIVIRQLGELGWKPHEQNASAAEFALLKALKHEKFAVPEVYLLDDSGATLPRPFVAMEFVDGTTAINPKDLPSAMDQAARFLADLHALNITNSPLPTLPQADDPRANLWDYLPQSDLEQSLRIALATTPSGREANRAALLHGDYWPGNWLWHRGQLAAIIDWEDSALGDPLADVACVRVELLCAFGEDAMETFTAHYRSRTDLDWSDLSLWEVYASAAALATMAQWGLEPAVEAKRRHATQGFMEHATVELLGQGGSAAPSS